MDERPEIVDDHGRRMLCHNITQVGEKNKILDDIPELEQALMKAGFHNQKNTFNYSCNLAINEAYVELATEEHFTPLMSIQIAFILSLTLLTTIMKIMDF